MQDHVDELAKGCESTVSSQDLLDLADALIMGPCCLVEVQFEVFVLRVSLDQEGFDGGDLQLLEYT